MRQPRDRVAVPRNLAYPSAAARQRRSEVTVAAGSDRNGLAFGIDETHPGALFDRADPCYRQLKLRGEAKDPVAGFRRRGKQQFVIVARGGEPRGQLRRTGDDLLRGSGQ